MLSPGSLLGPYEILAPIGAGGMGEVYRARDERLGRDVAVKILPHDHASDPDRLRRFETEARAVATLNHPNILSIFDLGSHDGTTYVVLELLEGRSLRELLGEGALPPRKVADYGIQICRGLAAAHEKGIVHRDIKPENLFLTRDGQIKILDFGLARLVRSVEGDSSESQLPTATAAGVVMGTAGYMSPEQARGLRADARSDTFAVGVVLYEMLSGGRAFSGETPADALTAILHKDPAELPPGSVPLGLERVVRRCLEKDPQERFQSARDVAFALEALSGSTGGIAVAEPVPRRIRGAALLAAAAALVALSSALAFHLGQSGVEPAVPEYTRVSRREGAVGTARFGADGLTVVYAGRFGGDPADLFRQRLDSPLARPFGLEGAVPVAARGSEVAVILGDRSTLARLPLDGGPPRELLEGVVAADWGPEGDFAVVRGLPDDSQRLEYPIGTVLLEARGQQTLGNVRLSPDGRLVAVVERPAGKTVSGGSVLVIDPAGDRRELSGGWASINGAAWSPDGREVWFTASRTLGLTALYAVDLSGRERLVLRAPGNLALNDVSPDGAVLVNQYRFLWQTRGRLAGDERERTLSLMGFTIGTALLPDGSAVGLHTVDQTTGEPGAFLQRAGEPVPMRLGDCRLDSLSPDGRWVLCYLAQRSSKEMVVLPTGPGEARTLPRGSIESYQWGFWSPDSRHVVFTAQAEGESTRLFVQDAREGLPLALTPEGVAYDFPRFRGSSVLSRNPGDPGDPWRLYPLDGSEPEPVPWLRTGETPLGWSEDGRYFFTYSSGAFPVIVERLEIGTGRREVWLELQPPDSASLTGLLGMELTPDGRHYAYTYGRELSELMLVEGLR